MAELDEFCKQPNVMLDEVYYDTIEDAQAQPWNKLINPGVSVLLQYQEVTVPRITNADCMRDNDGSRLFQENKNKFGY